MSRRPARRGGEERLRGGEGGQDEGTPDQGRAGEGQGRQYVEQRLRDQYVELEPREHRPDLRHPRRVRQPAAPGLPGPGHRPETPGPARFDGPLHNQIPRARPHGRQLARIWQADYNRQHYQDLYFGDGNGESLKTYYENQSSGRYSVDGKVTDWVKVPYNEARYGRSNGFPCADVVCDNTWDLVRTA